MKRILNLSLSCFNAGVNIITRVLLIILSASVYQSFVLVEVLLNNSNVWYPQCLSNYVNLIQNYLFRIMSFTLQRSTTKILEDDYVCEPCRDFAIAVVSNNLQNEVPGNEEAGPSTSRGHTNICLLCGCSILRRQSDKILKESPNEMQQTIITIIESKLAPREIVMLNSCMRWFLRFLVSLLAIIVHPLTYLINIKRNRKCPPPTNPLLFKSATTLAMMIRNKQITSEEVVSAYIERCKEVNPYLNAIVEPRYDMAIKEARCIDKMIASNERSNEDLAKEYPLLGIPMTVKESIAVEGMSNDCGTVFPYRNPAKKDADIVRRARAAGAIPIAVTNTPQLCMNWETYNNVSGLTMNPYDQKRTTGGSSGGEAALIASAASIIGVGSDIAGSLRLPPMFNGIFGHKPTPKLVSIEGHVPDCLDPEFDEYFALGPITRYAEDLPLLLKVLRQPTGPDVPLDTPVDLTRLKFYYMEGDGSNVTDKIGSDVKQALEKAKAYITSTYNVEVKELHIANIEHMWEISVRVLFNIQHVRNIYTDPEKRDQLISVWPEVLKKMIGMSDHNLTCVAYGPAKKFFDALPKNYYKKLLKVFDGIKSDFNEALSDDAVLLFPTFPYPAHLHYRIFYKFLNCGYLTIFNALGLPATACPLGLTNKGLPVGIQIVANKCNDHLTLAVAKEFEKAFGGWTPPNKDLFNSIKTA